MAIPKTSDLRSQIITNVESKINQTVPAIFVSFVRVLAFPLATLLRSLYQYAEERRNQNFIRTANLDTLKTRGAELGVIFIPEVSAILLIYLAADDGVEISANTPLIGESNGVRYIPNSTVTASGGSGIWVEVTSQTPGTVGNLGMYEKLILESAIAGSGNMAVVEGTVETGINDEDTEVYRQRILDEEQTVGGGGNGVDYRTNGQKTPGVKRIYPFAGRPLTEFTASESYPGERTIFVEATSDISTDGLAPQNLLDSVREYIANDQDTGQTQTPLGLPNLEDDTLYIRSIYRTGIFLEVRDLVVDEDLEYTVKNALKSAADKHLRSISMFVDGVDVLLDRNDSITSLNLSIAVDGVLKRYGATASGIGFGIQLGSFLSEYQLSQGELAKLEDINYA